MDVFIIIQLRPFKSNKDKLVCFQEHRAHQPHQKHVLRATFTHNHTQVCVHTQIHTAVGIFCRFESGKTANRKRNISFCMMISQQHMMLKKCDTVLLRLMSFQGFQKQSLTSHTYLLFSTMFSGGPTSLQKVFILCMWGGEKLTVQLMRYNSFTALF